MDTLFKIELLAISWLEHFDDPSDLCAHGKVRITIGGEVIVEVSENPDDWWSVTTMALHLLRTLDKDHIESNPVGDCLVPGEGHHIDYIENGGDVHIETAFPLARGYNWWVVHLNDEILLQTEDGKETRISFANYKFEVLNFVDQVESFYNSSKQKVLPEIDYDRIGYIKLWKEWKVRRQNWT